MNDVALGSELASDSPRSAFRVLQLRATLLTVAILVGLASVAWWQTVGTARDMAAMVQGIAQVGRGMPFGMGAAVFLGMWTTMMVAMMFPTVAPMVLLHRMVLRRRGEGIGRSVAFGSGYLVVWAVIGVLPLLALVGFRGVADGSMWVDRVGGAVLVLAGIYQFTGWKDACLKACRTPLTFLMTHDFGAGTRGALRVGISHGLYCLGCCWALMACLIAVGTMNPLAMVAIAALIFLEKNLALGELVVARLAAVALFALGVWLLLAPTNVTHLT